MRVAYNSGGSTSYGTCSNSLPFGDAFNCSPPAEAGVDQDFFAGFRIDWDNGYVAPARVYSATQGRWYTPDPAGLAAVDPTNPQTWNRYAYALNNPVSLVDPSGLDPGVNDTQPDGTDITYYNFADGDDDVEPDDGESVATFYALGLAYSPDNTATDMPIMNTGAESVPTFYALGLAYSPDNTATMPINAANNVQARVRLEQIANHLKNCGGVYPLVAASAGNFQIGSSPGHYAVTGPTDDPNNGFNGGNSTTTIDASNFANADPITQTGVVVHEWWHQMQINNSSWFRFKVFFNRKSVEAEANAAAAEALQKCGPG
jgi:RHS repeat-associated protein